MNLTKVLLITVAALLVTTIFSYPAMWEHNGIPLRQGVNIEWSRAATPLDNGTVLYVWSDTRYGGRDLWAQAVDEDGPVWTESLLVDGKPDRQEDPVVIKTSDGYAIVAWVDFSQDTINGDIFAQKVSPDGQVVWDGCVALSLAPGVQISLNIVPDEDGGAYIIWYDYRAGAGIDIYGVHIDGNGVNYPGWPIDGLPLASGTGNQSQHTLWEDGEGGAILAFINEVASVKSIHVKRILSDGEIAWTEVIADGMSANEAVVVRTQPFGDDFGFAWIDQRNDLYNVFVQVLDIDGNPVWNEEIAIHEQLAHQRNPRVVGTTDGNFVVVWEDSRENTADIYVQKVDINGNSLWADGGLPIAVDSFNQMNPRMESDGNGGVYVVWDDARDGGAPNVDVYMQHITSAGTISWEPNGRVVADIPGEAEAPLLKVADDNIFVAWGDKRTGSIGIYYQAFDIDGDPQLVDNGVEVYWGLSGDANEHQVVRNGDNVYVVWQDTRYANFGFQIKVQKIDSNGNMVFQENGISITEHTGSDQSAIRAIPHHDGGIAVTWVEQREYYDLVYAQAIDSEGNMLWGDHGLAVSTIEMFYPQQNPRISADGEAYVVVWDETDEYNVTYERVIKGQRIEDGQRVWDEEGEVLAWHFDGENIDHNVESLVNGRYLTWLRGDGAEAIIYAKKLDQYGSAAPGWDNYGLEVCNFMGRQGASRSVLTDEGLLVLWEDMRFEDDDPSDASIYGQLISEDGQILWEQNGIPIADYDNDQSIITAMHQDGFVYLTWREARVDPGAQSVAMQKIDLDGNLLWGDPAPFVVDNTVLQDNPTFGIFGDVLFFAWEDGYGELGTELSMQNADKFTGNTFWDADGETLNDSDKKQLFPKIAAFDDRYAFVAWIDGRSSGKEDIFGLYAQKVDTWHLNIDDVINTPVSNINLKANYPNPFNPETSIAFSLAQNNSVSLNVFNVKGQLVKTLIDNELMEKGNHHLLWKGVDNNNRAVGSGVYFYQLQTENESQVRKMLLLK